MSERPARRRPRGGGDRVDRLLGAAAQQPVARPGRARGEAPTSVRRAALVVAVEAAALAGVALWLLFLTFTSTAESVARAVAEVVYVGFFAVLLGAAAVGLWRVSGWARGPVIALQVLLGLFGWTTAFQADRPLIGLPILVLVGLELYLLFTPEARLAFLDR